MVSLHNGVLQEIVDRMSAQTDDYKSKKWSRSRFVEGLRNAGLNADRQLKKAGNVKPNEALGKKKPRLILSGGDQSVVAHIFDAGVLEDLMFNMKFFESRSINHTDFAGVAGRMASMAERSDCTSSLDFGAFDGSLGGVIRGEVEKSVLNTLLGHLIGACDFIG